TLYSSIRPGRSKRTIWPAKDTVPAIGRDRLVVPALAGSGAVNPTRRGGSEASPGTTNGAPVRPTVVATTRNRSFTALVTVEVSHRPARVASPSTRWKTQRNRAPSAV